MNQPYSKRPRLPRQNKLMGISWAPLLVGPALLAFSTPADEITFHPADGAMVTMTFEESSSMSLDDMSIARNGEEMDPAMLGDMEISMNTVRSITVTDEFVSMDGARPTTLKRSFDSLGSTTSTSTSNAMTGESEVDAESKSSLEGTTVVFNWNAESGEYDAAFDGEEGDPDLLEDLSVNLTLNGFLPDGQVDKGDTWDVSPVALRTLLAPGGSLKLEPVDSDSSGMEGAGPQPSPDQFLEDIEGTVTATYAGTRDVDGIQVAVIALEFGVTAAADLSELMADAIEGADMPMEGVTVEIESFDIEFEYEGEGELFWNLQAGLAHSCQLSGEVELLIEQAMALEIPGMGAMSMEQAMTFAGTQDVSMSSGE
ncbi:MAG: hypothetical protein ACI8QS_002313 [Planctomycetota bacterium]|jgi:hypothetical protein